MLDLDIENYRKLDGLNNSRLTWLKQVVLRGQEINNNADYFVLGSEVDKLITHTNYKSDSEQANEIYSGFKKNCPENFLQFISIANKQVAFCSQIEFDRFNVIGKSLHDIYLSGISIDIKTTECKTKNQFKDACKYFEYDRQSWWYHATAKNKRSWILGIQKTYPYNVFFVDADKDLKMHTDGKESAEYLSYIYYRLFLI